MRELRVTGSQSEQLPPYIRVPRAVLEQQIVTGNIYSTEICIFWGDHGYAVTICGKHVLGDRAMTKFAAELCDYDSISY